VPETRGIKIKEIFMIKTKIVATIGPSSESEVMLEKLMKAGLNVARFNMSHGSHPEHLAKYSFCFSSGYILNLYVYNILLIFYKNIH
jgi:hypothetical protein